jgi:uncharacterized protein involved in propanediol utilization
MFAVQTMYHSAKIYSRIGELMQGVLPDASAFLVSGLLSRRWFSEAMIEAPPQPDRRPNQRGADGPAEGAPLPPKAREALDILLGGKGMPAGVSIGLRSNIPPGKGLASSSADVLSVLSVVNDYLELGLGPEEIYRIAARVDPTDPCLSDDIVVFHQHSGQRGQEIFLPPVSLLYFDTAPGRCVETLGVKRHWPRGAGAFFAWLLQRLINAAEQGDYALLFDSITYSAEYNQMVLPLPGFDEYRRLAGEVGAGLMVAHSGTVAGLLVAPEQEPALVPKLMALVRSRGDMPIYREQYSSSYPRYECEPFTVL